jgi:hypothetical protein
VKLLEHGEGHLRFELRGSDRDVLTWVLRLYPVMPPGQAAITRTAVLDPDGERQQLLEEALTALRKENQRRIESFLSASRRFEPSGENFILRLTDAEADWLLEVLNEIRVGSWVRLGRPQQGKEPELPVHKESLGQLWAMELCGYLESRLLEGLATHP